jgi:hypothetical protein
MLLFCPLSCRDGFFRSYIPLTIKLGGILKPKESLTSLTMNDLNVAIASSECQPVLPWSIPEALGLNVNSILDLKTLPFALVAFISDKGASNFKVLLQLQVSPAMITERGLPPWIIVTRSRMFCWRQSTPIRCADTSPKKEDWLLQFSTHHPKLLSLLGAG